jgi:hypothetical protein
MVAALRGAAIQDAAAAMADTKYVKMRYFQMDV